MNAKEKCCYEFGTFRLDTAEHTLFHKGQAVHLTPKAIETLLVLVENHGHLVEKDELLEKVWEGSFVEESNIAKNISVLRKTLSGNGLKEPIIETIPTRGYRFVTPLNETEVDAPQEATVEIGAPQAGKDPDRAKLARSSKNNRVVPILSVGIIAAIAGLAVGGWYFLPSLIRGDEPNAKTTQVSLSNGFERVSGGVISPDGKLVAFRRIREGKQETLAVRRLADGETIDLVPDLDRDFAIYATFSPDSKSVYYNRYRKDNEGVYRVPVTGGPVERLIAGRYSDVAVSRDGNQLAFYRLHPEKTEGTVLVADKNGNNEKAISTVKLTNLYNQLVFSNDGQRVLIWEHIKE
ncbi:MAG: winged helix-turn-helix domain-containing protein, partial [Acidobacteriota bacterium]|nr:winged helix-turn-helix domain-containing protein [Acidobacteriota bacterium]